MAIVVTRHKALVELLQERGIIGDDVKVIDHVALPSMLDGHDVIGVLPLYLAARCRTVTEVPLNIRPDERGKELDLDRLRDVAGDPVTYQVIRVA